MPTRATTSPAASAPRFGPIPSLSAVTQPFFDLGNGTLCRQHRPLPRGHDQQPGVRGLSGYFAGPGCGGATTPSRLNQWQFFAVTEDAHGNVTLYKNGAAIATGTTDVPRSGIVARGQLPGQEQLQRHGYASYAGGLDEAAFFATPLVGRPDRGALCPAVYGTVTINLLQNGVVVQNIASERTEQLQLLVDHSRQRAAWLRLPGPRHREQRLEPRRPSAQQFLIANNGHSYYINDNSTGRRRVHHRRGQRRQQRQGPRRSDGDPGGPACRPTLSVPPTPFTSIPAITPCSTTCSWTPCTAARRSWGRRPAPARYSTAATPTPAAMTSRCRADVNITLST